VAGGASVAVGASAGGPHGAYSVMAEGRTGCGVRSTFENPALFRLGSRTALRQGGQGGREASDGLGVPRVAGFPPAVLTSAAAGGKQARGAGRHRRLSNALHQSIDAGSSSPAQARAQLLKQVHRKPLDSRLRGNDIPKKPGRRYLWIK
jgi:hypothetical protein